MKKHIENSKYDKECNNGLLKNVIGFVALLLLISIIIYGVMVPMIVAYQVKYLSKDTKNIKDNGCLIFANKTDKYGGSMFYINKQGPYTFNQIVEKEFPFENSFKNLIKTNNRSYDEFKKIHTKECIKIRYIHHKLLWTSGDYIYDLQ